MVRPLLFALVLLAGCQTASGTFCDVAKPYRLTDATIDAMTDEEARAALEHNRKGERLCGWKP